MEIIPILVFSRKRFHWIGSKPSLYNNITFFWLAYRVDYITMKPVCNPLQHPISPLATKVFTPGPFLRF